MSWTINGRYFENCTCEVVCPCTASFALGADYDRCEVVLVFHVDSGEIEGVDVRDLTVAAVIDSPKVMSEGDWRMGLLVDAAASDEQAAKLGAVFGGQLGGPLQALVPLITGMLGVERVPMQFTSNDGRHALVMGDVGQLEVEDVVPFGIETGEPARLAGIFHPLGTELTISKSTDSRLNVFGLAPALAGKSGFSTTFAWSG
jgi:hypothetical protein